MKSIPPKNQAKILVLMFLTIFASTIKCSEEIKFGTFDHPFAADSPWNMRPIQPIFGDAIIQKSVYHPTVAEGKWSTGVFKAKPNDPSVVIYPLENNLGVWDPDSEKMFPSITIPRWPSEVIPASGTDGHAEIIDESMGIIHSIFKLRKDGDVWRAEQYAWSSLNGRGWGEPGHYFQGARATGVPSTGGLIRKSEINNGLPYFRHALALSLTYNSLSPGPTFVFPATSADGDAAKKNTGSIPEGSLLMLPADYKMQHTDNKNLSKIVETLKKYGGYVVDRNVGTPFVIYVENGSNFRLMGEKWDSSVAHEMDKIRSSLRPVLGSEKWLDGNSELAKINYDLNLLSMRGEWQLTHGKIAGVFDTWKQAIIFPEGSANSVQKNSSKRSINASLVPWAYIKTGETVRLTSNCTGGSKLQLILLNEIGDEIFDSGKLSDKEFIDFKWPAGFSRSIIYAYNGASDDQSSVSGTLIRKSE